MIYDIHSLPEEIITKYWCLYPFTFRCFKNHLELDYLRDLKNDSEEQLYLRWILLLKRMNGKPHYYYKSGNIKGINEEVIIDI
jgi:hypothetical protein